MGLFDKKSKREVGSNFSEDEANEIFDSLDKVSGDSKKPSKTMQKELDKTKEVSDLLNQAKSSDDETAIGIYEKVIAILPDTGEAYLGLSKIYQKNGDKDNEIRILKLALKNLKSNDKIKNELMARLKELNS